MTDKKQLDFAVIGAQKCATSWMYYCLQDHPEICLPRKKREIAYIGGEQFKKNGPDWFFNRFSCSTEKTKGDVSVDYLYDGKSATELAKYTDKPKLVISLRNPVRRAISSYYWLCRSGVIEVGNVNDWISSLPDDSNNWSEAIGNQESQVILRGFYALQIIEYFEHFSPDDFYVTLYEDVQVDPLLEIQKVYRFLEVDSDFVPPNLNTKPKKNSYNKFLLAFENKFRSKLTSHLANFAHQKLDKFGKSKTQETQVSPDSIAKLHRIFESHSESLFDLIERVPASNRPSIERIKEAWDLDHSQTLVPNSEKMAFALPK